MDNSSNQPPTPPQNSRKNSRKNLNTKIVGALSVFDKNYVAFSNNIAGNTTFVLAASTKDKERRDKAFTLGYEEWKKHVVLTKN